VRGPNGKKSKTAADHFFGLAFEAQSELSINNLGASVNVWEIWLQGPNTVSDLAAFCSRSVSRNLLGANIIRPGIHDALSLVDIPSRVLTRWESTVELGPTAQSTCQPQFIEATYLTY
jgi:hypothetical protein